MRLLIQFDCVQVTIAFGVLPELACFEICLLFRLYFSAVLFSTVERTVVNVSFAFSEVEEKSDNHDLRLPQRRLILNDRRKSGHSA